MLAMMTLLLQLSMINGHNSVLTSVEIDREGIYSTVMQSGGFVVPLESIDPIEEAQKKALADQAIADATEVHQQTGSGWAPEVLLPQNSVGFTDSR